MDFLVNILINLNNLTGSLGLTLIIIGILSRIIFYPATVSSIRQSKKMADLRPKLEEIKKRHGSDKKKLAEEQARLYRESGISALGCLAPIVQLVVALVLFQVLLRLLKTGVETDFLIWDLAKPDSYAVANIPFKLPGVLVILTAVATFIQSKMSLPEPVHEYKSDSPKEKKEKEGFAEAMAASQGQMVYLFPFLILFTGTLWPSGLALYWIVSTILGIIQQYYIAGWGSLKPWIQKLPLKT
ncbi:MAG: YidC/Oxa1 family membrane protein insertase [Candidatus Woykebacteria bacterium]